MHYTLVPLQFLKNKEIGILPNSMVRSLASTGPVRLLQSVGFVHFITILIWVFFKFDALLICYKLLDASACACAVHEATGS